MSDQHTPGPALEEADFDLMDWIETGTIARRTVVVHNDPAAADRFLELEKRLAELGFDDEDDLADAPLGSPSVSSEVDAIRREHAELYARWEASRATWTVRAVSEEEVEAIVAAIPAPKMPVPPLEKAGRAAHEAYYQKVAEYTEAKKKFDDEVNLAIIARAVEKVETAQGTARGVTVDQLRKLKARPHGAQWIDRLRDAVSAATEGDVDVPRPTSPGASTSTPG